MFNPNAPFGMNDPRLLPLIQARGMTPGMTPGPVPNQPLTPGFHAPGAGGMAAPPQMAPDNSMQNGMGMMGLAAAMARRNPTAPTTPGQPTPNGDPTGGAGPAFLGGTSPLGNPMAAADPSVAMPNAGFLDFLTGLRTKLFA